MCRGDRAERVVREEMNEIQIISAQQLALLLYN